jgi:hypothetical protein
MSAAKKRNPDTGFFGPLRRYLICARLLHELVLESIKNIWVHESPEKLVRKKNSGLFSPPSFLLPPSTFLQQRSIRRKFEKLGYRVQFFVLPHVLYHRPFLFVEDDDPLNVTSGTSHSRTEEKLGRAKREGRAKRKGRAKRIVEGVAQGERQAVKEREAMEDGGGSREGEREDIP